ncbi:HigA family addiction module antitoxin [Moritella viscosa]|uniref:HigA family addiction module antitoxin n=1 Tax=Moritella viscosa TaxID=80854 RepID=UPI000913CCF4|nr:HigA family addiction module antitoxin [Moritella viscosa]SHO15898.1 Plasmid maintenance system antidote protein HigA [Moritella viscosa]SHO17826.1 Plasmid maintenance system antidote protein HigA [Moritella viscosa]SHO19078.1 Plasmid maintenance system antidote protein HigA [Moritella viscosa]
MRQTRKPSHPGRFFKHTILDQRDISITAASVNLGVTRKALSEFVNGKAKCSHAMARRLAEATGTGVGIWIMMQAKLDTWEAENMDIDSEIIPFEKQIQA